MHRSRFNLVAAGLAGLILILAYVSSGPALAQGREPVEQTQSAVLVSGVVFDEQNVPVKDALVTVVDGRGEQQAEGATQSNGRYALSLEKPIPDSLILHIERPHFEETDVELGDSAVQTLRAGEPVEMPEVILARVITPAFWVA
ncbi:MAG: carboxypeptidase-like regulatory domain-containing protein, partial [Chloroflexota bacterium]